MTGDAERERKFASLDRFRASLPEYDEDEVLADATEAFEAVRRAKDAEGTTTPPAGEASPPDEEMGGEAPCQLHRFWDVDE
jgi:hypothetical protein